MDAELIKDMVEFIGLTKEAMDELKNRPAFSKTAVEETVGALVTAGLVRKSDADTLTTLYQKDPDKALRSLQKIAQSFRRPEDVSLGKPGDKRPAPAGRESDRVLFTRFGIS